MSLGKKGIYGKLIGRGIGAGKGIETAAGKGIESAIETGNDAIRAIGIAAGLGFFVSTLLCGTQKIDDRIIAACTARHLCRMFIRDFHFVRLIVHDESFFHVWISLE